MIKEIKKRSTTSAIVEELKNYIIDNELQPGDPLPTEYELTSLLKVSRGILREALRHFRALGIIETAPKIGIRIKNFIPQKPLDEFIPYLKSNKEKLLELMQIRMIIEIGIIPILINNATEEDLEGLEEMAQKMKNVSIDERKKLDREFHSSLLSIINNEILTNIQPTISYFDLHEKYPELLKESKTSEEVSREHLDIVAALREKNAQKLQDIFISRHYKLIYNNNK
jgi:DNA-binding FadR family transcriptional regulator